MDRNSFFMGMPDFLPWLWQFFLQRYGIFSAIGMAVFLPDIWKFSAMGMSVFLTEVWQIFCQIINTSKRICHVNGSYF
jgi:hypothetical protein